MIIVSDRPCTGVDMSHWNTDPTPGLLGQKNWLEFFGHKAVHFGDKNMSVDSVDPKFASRRILASQLDIRWRAFYMWLVPFTIVNPAVQVERLLRAIGKLKEGESVYLDWEDPLVNLSMVDEFSFYMDREFSGRWFMYVNDSNPEMTQWLSKNKITDHIPVMHPNYNREKGLSEARKWNAAIWQTGEATPPGFVGNVPIDYVLRPDVMDRVCGRQ